MLWGLVGVYHTQLSVAYVVSFVHISEQKKLMFDVGDLPILTFGNCVLKAE